MLWTTQMFSRGQGVWTKDNVKEGIIVAREIAQCVKSVTIAPLNRPPRCLVLLVLFQTILLWINASCVLLANIKIKKTCLHVNPAYQDMNAPRKAWTVQHHVAREHINPMVDNPHA